jgi:hypothetical protein
VWGGVGVEEVFVLVRLLVIGGMNFLLPPRGGRVVLIG